MVLTKTSMVRISNFPFPPNLDHHQRHNISLFSLSPPSSPSSFQGDRELERDLEGTSFNLFPNHFFCLNFELILWEKDWILFCYCLSMALQIKCGTKSNYINICNWIRSSDFLEFHSLTNRTILYLFPNFLCHYRVLTCQ